VDDRAMLQNKQIGKNNGCAITLLSATAVASDSQAPGGAEQRQHDRKGGRDVGLRGHGFVQDNSDFIIDAPTRRRVHCGLIVGFYLEANEGQ
jgi:hypothetical protein